MKNEDRAPGQVGIEVFVAPTPSLKATNSLVVMRGYIWNQPLLNSPRQLYVFPFLINLIGNVSVSVYKFVGHM